MCLNRTAFIRRNGLAHLLYGVHRFLHAADVAGVADGVDGHLDDAGADGAYVVDAEGLGDHGHVGQRAVPAEVGGADAALKLTGHAGDDQVAP